VATGTDDKNGIDRPVNEFIEETVALWEREYRSRRAADAMAENCRRNTLNKWEREYRSRRAADPRTALTGHCP